MNSITEQGIILPGYKIPDEREYQEDKEYLMQMYPAKAKIIMCMIENECDKLEYDTSPMYARYPDKETLLYIAGQITGRICGDSHDEALEQLIQVLFLNECRYRRSKYRRRRKFY